MALSAVSAVSKPNLPQNGPSAMQVSSPTYIIGHKNPDADAICSAIAYASFKAATGQSGCMAARCGNSNERIDTILHRFNTPLPPFVGDLTPRVQDIMVSRDRLHKVGVDATCAEALELIDRYDIRALPVVDDDNRAKGVVSIFGLGEFFIPKADQLRRMRHVRSSVSSIVRCLNAKVIHANDPDRIEDLYVRIGAMDIRSFDKFSREENVTAKHSIIVVGDRYDIQQKSIQLGVRMLVITGGLEIDEGVIEMAREKDVALIVSPLDSATTSWIIRTATRLEPMIDSNIIAFRPDERLSQVKRKIANSYAPIYCVVDDRERLVGIFSKTDLLRPVQTNLIMVDHNELSQAVNGAHEVNIIEIVDHHRLGNPPTSQPILFRNEPVGSTCTIVAEMFRRHGLTPSADIAGILMSGIISDTLNLQSPTTTDRDRDLMPWLEGIAGIVADDLAKLIFSSGSVILNSTPDAVILSDLKSYEEGSVRFSVSQVEELGFNNFWEHSEAILEALEDYRSKNNLLFSALLVTDINTQNSLLLVQGDAAIIDLISYPVVKKNRIFDMPGVVSRKKQLIPYLTNLIEQQ